MPIKYTFCDFETTGLLKEGHDWVSQPGICQIGIAVTDEEFNILETFGSLVNPEKPVWEEQAIKTHGITPDMVANSPTFFAIFPKLASLFLGSTHWGGFNNPFDKGILWHQLIKYGFEKNFPWPIKDHDVMHFAKQKMEMQGKRGLKNPKLTEIYEHLFNEPFGAHDAVEDIKATVRVAKELNNGQG